MSKIKIITTPDPRLREPSKKVTEITPTVKNIIKKMVEASLDWEKIHEHELSAAMAAPQLGENVRIIIIRDDLDDKENNHFTALINPEILSTSGRIEKDYEGSGHGHIFGEATIQRIQFSSVAQSCPTLQLHESQHTRLPCSYTKN